MTHIFLFYYLLLKYSCIILYVVGVQYSNSCFLKITHFCILFFSLPKKVPSKYSVLGTALHTWNSKIKENFLQILIWRKKIKMRVYQCFKFIPKPAWRCVEFSFPEHTLQMSVVSVFREENWKSLNQCLLKKLELIFFSWFNLILLSCDLYFCLWRKEHSEHLKLLIKVEPHL